MPIIHPPGDISFDSLHPLISFGAKWGEIDCSHILCSLKWTELAKNWPRIPPLVAPCLGYMGPDPPRAIIFPRGISFDFHSIQSKNGRSIFPPRFLQSKRGEKNGLVPQIPPFCAP